MPETTTQEKKTKKKGSLSTVSVIILSLIFTAVAGLMLFVPGIRLIYLTYAICGLAVVLGIYLIVHYFMTDAFRNTDEYGFSLGVLWVILGICGMIRASVLTQALLPILGMAMILAGVILLQYALDLQRMDDAVWFLGLIFSVLILLCGAIVLVQPFGKKAFFDQYVWYGIFVSGIVEFLFTIYLMIRVHLFKKAEEKKQKAGSDAGQNGAEGSASENGSEENAAGEYAAGSESGYAADAAAFGTEDTSAFGKAQLAADPDSYHVGIYSLDQGSAATGDLNAGDTPQNDTTVETTDN